MSPDSERMTRHSEIEEIESDWLPASAVLERWPQVGANSSPRVPLSRTLMPR
jgi:hypothetical protein